LGSGVIVEEIAPKVRVRFASGELTMMAEEIQSADATDLDGPWGESDALGPPHDVMSSRADPSARNLCLGNPVICPSRPDLGLGVLSSRHRVYRVKYDSGLRTQTDVEIRPAAPDSPDPTEPACG
jgi:hypothetical protein